jgi:hypothetical protein
MISPCYFGPPCMYNLFQNQKSTTCSIMLAEKKKSPRNKFNFLG